MDTQLQVKQNVTLEDLIDQGSARILEREQAQKLAARKAIEEQMQEEALFMSAADVHIPQALRRYHSFESWHTYNHGNGSTWRTTTLLEVPGLAPIRIRWSLWYPPDNSIKVEIWTPKHSNYRPISVIRFEAAFDDFSGEFYVAERYAAEPDDLLEALAIANKIGDTRHDAINDAQVAQLNRDLNPPAPPPMPTLGDRLEVILRSLIREEINSLED